LGERVPREPGGEEYLDSEKYQLRHWDLERPDSLRDFITRVNRIRRENPALQSDWSLRFHPLDNEQLICYSKRYSGHAAAGSAGASSVASAGAASGATSNVILVVVNLDPEHTHSGWTNLPLAELGLAEDESYQVHDLITDARYLWQGARNYLELNPQAVPAHIFRLARRVRTERDFDYYL
jgi:starch synthase (maltosyl-transferring)